MFKARPYARNIARSLSRQPKYFLYDGSEVSSDGGRFENLVASHLWKAVQLWTDAGEGDFALHYVRDRDGREADFLLTRDRAPWLLVEAKLADARVSDPLRFFSNRLNIPGIQLVLQEGIHRREGNLSVTSADRWLGRLP